MELQDIVNRLRMKQSIKAIKRETGKHRSVIRRVLQLAEQEGWLDEQQELPSEQQLQEVYHEQRIGEEGRLWRDNQGENVATIKMRMPRRLTAL